MQHLEVSGAVRPLVNVRHQKVKEGTNLNESCKTDRNVHTRHILPLQAATFLNKLPLLPSY